MMNDFGNIHSAVTKEAILGNDASFESTAPTGQPWVRAIESYDMQIMAIAIEKIKIM